MLLRHEHLYGKIKENMITSDNFPKSGSLNKVLQGAQVILCTLSMISNPKLQLTGLTQVVPILNVIIDEASQVEVGQYVPLFRTFGETLRKICFVGDDKQCELLRRHHTARNSAFRSAASRTRRSTESTVDFRTRALEGVSYVP
jgi:superfamily I DNA and/or RNA helicase